MAHADKPDAQGDTNTAQDEKRTQTTSKDEPRYYRPEAPRPGQVYQDWALI